MAKHKVNLLTEYSWSSGSAQYSSGHPAAIELNVERQFEEEAKALPGGSSAILYLILPIVSALLSYGFFDSLRKGEGIRVPEFKTTYLAPSILIAIVLNIAMLSKIKEDESLFYADSTAFAHMLLWATVIGAAIPLLRWLGKAVQWKLCGYTEKEKDVDYVSKVLRTAPDGKVIWIDMTVQGVRWEGVLLQQPDESVVLGRRFQLLGSDGVRADEEFDASGAIKDQKGLVRKIRSKKLGLKPFEAINRSGVQQDQTVVLVGIKISEATERQETTKPLLKPVT